MAVPETHTSKILGTLFIDFIQDTIGESFPKQAVTIKDTIGSCLGRTVGDVADQFFWGPQEKMDDAKGKVEPERVTLQKVCRIEYCILAV